jgi:hypothetical protein
MIAAISVSRGVPRNDRINRAAITTANTSLRLIRIAGRSQVESVSRYPYRAGTYSMGPSGRHELSPGV